MKQYYQINVFNQNGDFKNDEITYRLAEGKKHFFIFFPRYVQIKEFIKFCSFNEKNQPISYCIHDKNLLNIKNQSLIGRNLSFYYSLINSGAKVENVSFHLDNIYGFGMASGKSIFNKCTDLKLAKVKEKERFYCSTFDAEEYEKIQKNCFNHLKNILEIADQSNIKILIKNLSMDYLFLNQNQENYFFKKGYKGFKISPEEKIEMMPVLVNKGEFPKTSQEMINIKKQFNLGFALDIEHLRNTVLLSKRYNLKNEKMLKLWDIRLDNHQKEYLAKNGFVIEKGKPIFFEKELDLYEQIFSLKGQVEIAHLSGSIGPIFVDKKNLKQKEVTNDLLLGILKDSDIPLATVGKRQSAIIENFTNKNPLYNFNHLSSQKIWQEIFKKQFLEDIFLLKEINCSKVIQKMKTFSREASETFSMFNHLTEVDFSELSEEL